MLTIAVLFGGCSTEHGVSLQSAAAVLRHLDRTRYRPIPIGITQEGNWFRYEGPIERIQAGVWAAQDCTPALISPDRGVHGLLTLYPNRRETTRLDAAFPVLHGKNGEDGTIQGLLALAGIPIVGCGCLSTALCMDKELAHRLVREAGIAVPESELFEEPVAADEAARRCAALVGPLFVKPVCSGSSLGITRVTDRAQLAQAIAQAFRHDGRVLVEQAVPGFEVGCAVLGNQELTVGEVDEIELSGEFFDYWEKYTLTSARVHTPARIDAETASRVKRTACAIYQTLHCAGFARVDLFLTPEGHIVFNEVNAIPGLTTHSRYPRMMEGAGISFSALLDRLIALAVAA